DAERTRHHALRGGREPPDVRAGSHELLSRPRDAARLQTERDAPLAQSPLLVHLAQLTFGHAIFRHPPGPGGRARHADRSLISGPPSTWKGACSGDPQARFAGEACASEWRQSKVAYLALGRRNEVETIGTLSQNPAAARVLPT